MRTHEVLDQLAMQGVRLGLDRIRDFLRSLGDPHLAYPVVHVAGTNGKGSVCALVTQALTAAGYRVGTTLSPHVESLNERIQIDGVPVDDGTLTEAIEAIDRARWDWARAAGIEGTPLTYFEFMIAAAFQVFSTRQVDVAVVEVGLGGRLDATNVVQPLVCAIPSIGLDHTEQLGETLGEIATEKAGIIKRGVPVVIGPMPSEASERIALRCRQLGCALWRPPALRRERRGRGWSLATPEGTIRDLALTLEGAHQGANAMVALGALHRLREEGFVLTEEAIREGFVRAAPPARLERLGPGLVVDGAHNEAGARALATWLSEQPRPDARILLLGMGEGRDPVSVVTPLLPWVDEVVTTRCAHPRARDPMELAMALREAIDADLSAAGPIERALPEVLEDADEVVVTGSLFVAGAARAVARDAGLLGGKGDAS